MISGESGGFCILIKSAARSVLMAARFLEIFGKKVAGLGWEMRSTVVSRSFD